MFSLAASQSAEMPRSSRNVTPNYFPISRKQLLPVQHGRSLIGDTQRQRPRQQTASHNASNGRGRVGGEVRLSPAGAREVHFVG